MSRRSVGIIGVGSHLPPDVRRNDFWPPPLVAGWEETARRSSAPPPPDLTSGERRVYAAMAALRNDPFRGAVERRVLAEPELPSELERRAAEKALAQAGIAAGDVDLLLTSSFVPDVINVPNAAVLHDRLGLPGRCVITGLDAACNALPLQIAFAEQMIAGGEARFALLVQSSVLSRLLPFTEPFSTYFGDGASAVVLGAVPDGYGILGRAHFANGRDAGGLVASVPGKRWYDEGRCYWYQDEKHTVFRMLLTIADIGEQALTAALTRAGVGPSDVDFFACHQGTPWFRGVIQEQVGMRRARTLDTFPFAASLIGANLGLIFDLAAHDGALRRGDLVAAFASGVGSTWSALVLRWGS